MGWAEIMRLADPESSPASKWAQKPVFSWLPGVWRELGDPNRVNSRVPGDADPNT